MELNGLGYDGSDIVKLRGINETSTEADLAAASSDLSLYVYAGDKHGHNSSLSWAVFSARWIWHSKPVFCEKDIVAIGWSEGMYLTPASESTYTFAYINYYDEYGDYWGQEIYDVVPDLNTGASTTFRQGKSVGGVPEIVWAQSGAMGIKLTKQANIPEMCIQAAYGHSTLSGTPTVDFGISGSGATATIGISFSWTVKSLVSKYLYLEL